MRSLSVGKYLKRTKISYKDNTYNIFYKQKVPSTLKRPTSFLYKPIQSKTVIHTTKKSKSGIEVDLFPQWLQTQQKFRKTISKLNTKNKDIYNICKKTHHNRNTFEKKALLMWAKNSSFFENIKHHMKRSICDKLQSVEFEDGEILMKEGDQGDCAYILIKGKLEIFKGDNHIATIEPFNSIGEQSIISGQARNATVKAQGKVKAFKIEQKAYQNVVYSSRLQMKFQNIQVLKKNKLFSQYPLCKLQMITQNLFEVHYSQNQVIYSSLQTINDLYIVKEGQVQLEAYIDTCEQNVWPVARNEWGSSQVNKQYKRVIRKCFTGDFFGETELIQKTQSKCVARSCSKKTILLLLSQQEFFNQFNKHDQQSLLQFYPVRPSTPNMIQDLRFEINRSNQTLDALMDIYSLKNIKNYKDTSVQRKISMVREIKKKHRRQHSA